MNRLIKFRVWDELEKRMVSWEEAEDTELLVHAFRNKDAVAMQFTGLKDKNGVDIYEGDIVEWQKEVTAGGYNLFNFEVKYSVNSGYETCIGGFHLKAINYENPYTGDKFIQTCGLLQGDNPDGFCIKIIGNIFENPDLLNAKTN